MSIDTTRVLLVFEGKKIVRFKKELAVGQSSEKTDSKLCLRLDVCFLQAVALCEVVDLVAALIGTVIINPH